MAKNLSGLPNKPQLALLFAIVGVSAFMPAASAEQNAASPTDSAQNGSVSASQPILRPDPAGSVLDARWGVHADEFVLNEDGQLRQSEAVLSASTAAGELNQDGTVFALASATGEQHHSGSVFGSNRGAVSIGAQVVDCGPSPATPEEIRELIIDAAQRHGVDTTFALAIASTESNFDQNRNSPKGARGPMQLMPATASRFGVEDVCDPASNIEGGVRYLRELTEEFRNPLLVAAAYNAGEGRVREYGGIPPFDETVGYVAKVVNYQLGLPDLAPMRGRAAIDATTTSATNDATPETGVITNAKRRQWVGGVMQF
jgi:Transglycosylase SLT domain